MLNHVSLDGATPFRASHAIFVRDGAEVAFDAEDALPPALLARPQSLRGFDTEGMMRAADIATGHGPLTDLIARLLNEPRIVEIHAQDARQGCYMARITRA